MEILLIKAHQSLAWKFKNTTIKYLGIVLGLIDTSSLLGFQIACVKTVKVTHLSVCVSVLLDLSSNLIPNTFINKTENNAESFVLFA